MVERTLEEQLEADAAKAVKAARPHLMKAWAAAVQLGHKGGFDDWLVMVFADLDAEVNQVFDSIPPGERAHAPLSPWWRGQ